MKIEKGVPIPPRQRLSPAAATEFDALEVGDSFAVAVPDEYRAKPTVWIGTNRLRNAAYFYGKRHNKKLTVRIIREEGVIRVWRLK